MKSLKPQTAKVQKPADVAPKREARSASKTKEVQKAAPIKSASSGKNQAPATTKQAVKAPVKVAPKATAKVPTKDLTKTLAKAKKVETVAKKVSKPAQKPKTAKPATVIKVGGKRQGGKTAIGKAASKHGGNAAKRLRKH